MVSAGNALGVLSRKFHIPPLKNQRDKKAQWFFRDEAIHVVCRVSEKPLQRSRWDFLRRHQDFNIQQSKRGNKKQVGLGESKIDFSGSF